jgi:hypothetical protein
MCSPFFLSSSECPLKEILLLHFLLTYTRQVVLWLLALQRDSGFDYTVVGGVYCAAFPCPVILVHHKVPGSITHC